MILDYPQLYMKYKQDFRPLILVLISRILVFFGIVGGKLVYQSTKKRASGPKCPVTGKRIQGVS